MPQDRIWTVAVAGCGVGRNHIAQGYGKHPDKFRVVAVCDIDEGRRAAVGDEFSVPRRTRSFDEVLRMGDVDIVDICTPAMLHFEQILATLSAGKEVVCEKPLVGSIAEIDQIIAAGKATPGRVMPIFQYRFGNGVQKAKRIIEVGDRPASPISPPSRQLGTGPRSITRRRGAGAGKPSVAGCC